MQLVIKIHEGKFGNTTSIIQCIMLDNILEYAVQETWLTLNIPEEEVEENICPILENKECTLD